MHKVILLSHGFQAEYEVGFANGLARNGIGVILVGSDTTLRERLDPRIEFLNLRGSQRPDRPRREKLRNMIRYLATYLYFVARHRGTPVHVIGLFSTRNLWVSLAEAWLVRWLSGGYLLTVHNLLPHDSHGGISARLCRWIYSSADRLMVHTEHTAAELGREFGVGPERVVVIEHGIDAYRPPDAGARASMRKRLGLSPEHRVALFFGTISPYKGVDILLEAFALPAARIVDKLVVAGYCRDRTLAASLAARVEAHPRCKDIVWREGYVPDADILPLLHCADVLVLPYRHIDQSGVVFMAIATGLPTVATDVGSLAQYVPKTGGMVVPPEDPDALSQAMGKIIATVPGTRVISDDGQYLWKKTVTSLVPLYHNALGRSTPCPLG